MIGSTVPDQSNLWHRDAQRLRFSHQIIFPVISTELKLWSGLSLAMFTIGVLFRQCL